MVIIDLDEGRRRELISAALFYLVGAIVTAVAPNLAILVIGRFVYGIGIGLVMYCMPCSFRFYFETLKTAKLILYNH